MNYPKEIMSRKELIQQGYPPEFLRRVWNTPGQQVAFLLNPVLKDKSLTMCQDVTPNTAEGKKNAEGRAFHAAGIGSMAFFLTYRQLFKVFGC